MSFPEQASTEFWIASLNNLADPRRCIRQERTEFDRERLAGVHEQPEHAFQPLARGRIADAFCLCQLPGTACEMNRFASTQ
ncbi:MAG: hypothetical protein M3065_06585 [Actinomycetota bacterium]|nr:hypothetical protein [Actinomycetota bacterium]